MHLRRQPIAPKKNRLFLYIQPWERGRWDDAAVRPLHCMVLLEEEIARLRDKGIYVDSVATMLCASVRRMMDLFGQMEQLLDSPTLPFAYYQFCNWAIHVFVLTAPAAIATHDTYYAASALLSFGVAAVLLGLNFMGDLLMEPFGIGVHALPLEHWGIIMERELHQFIPFFGFRFGCIPLFVETCEILPPDDPRLLHKSIAILDEQKSLWVPARNKARAAMRLGNRKMRRMREAKDLREAEVALLVRTRPTVDSFSDLAALLGAMSPGMSKGGKARSGNMDTDAKGGKEKRGEILPGREEIPPELTKEQDRRSKRAPTELAPKPAQQKQAALLAKKFPESDSL
jgi:hypothetical protein